MMVLLDTSHSFDDCAAELGCEIGQLLTSHKRFRVRPPGMVFAVDNRAFTGFDAKAFTRLLSREEHHRSACKFVTVPDVVGSARRTLEVFDHFTMYRKR